MNIKRAALPSLAVLVLMGCDAATDAVSDSVSDSIADTVAPDPAKRVSSLLMDNDPSACAEDEAIQTALGAANRDYLPYLQNGGEKVRVDTISATEIKKDIHEITCSSVIHYRLTNEKGLSNPFKFKLRPMVGGEGASFVAEVPSVRMVSTAIWLHMSWWENEQKAASAADEPTADGTAAGEPIPQKTSWSPSEEKLIEEYSNLNSDCRGSSDPAVSDPACSERDKPNSVLKRRLRAANICLGRESDESAADNEFHRCTADSYQF